MKVFDTWIREYTLKQQRDQLEQERLKLINVVCEKLKECRQKCNIRAAYIVGSILQPQRWYPFSDIDVAVIGCPDHILSIMKELEDATGKQVDVIELDRHSTPDLLIEKGMKVYG